MNQQIKRDEIRVFFKSTFGQAGYTRDRIRLFCKTAERLHDYLVIQNEPFYTQEIGERFIQMERQVGQIGNNVLKTDRRAIEVLNMILSGEPILLKVKKVIKSYPGEIGEALKKCLHYLENQVRCAPSSVSRYESVLNPFSVYCHMHGIGLQNIDYSKVVGYMSSRQNSDSKTVSVLRIFFRYLYDEGMIEKDFSRQLAVQTPRKREKIPSFYKKEEILQIENGIERATAKGKRNYAIVKLASRLGLRASDIASLEFSNIDWERDRIRLKQKKTGKNIELPLLTDVGNAIIDYIRYGRPQDTRKILFLSHISPHRPLTSSAISSIVSTCITNAGIDIDGRHRGAHSLRHSLAYNMLTGGSKLETISNALGHTSVESTMYYMGIDLAELVRCSLVVPPVDSSFYNQGGGLLYD